MQSLIKFTIVFIVVFLSIKTKGQVTISASSFNLYNVTPSSVCQIIVLNLGSEGQVYIEAKVLNSANEQLMTVVTNPFTLKQGLNNILPSQISFSNIQYASSNQSNFLKVNHRLPSGIFQYCVKIIPISNLEEGDEYCIDVETNEDWMMYLVFPSDQEILETKTPLLIWMHNEPFNILAPGEFYRMLLVEVYDDQNGESAILSNPPLFIKNYVNKHQVQYPLDAPDLEGGKRYAWKVQKIAKNNIVSQTEAWEFSIAMPEDDNDLMFVTMKRKLDGSYYNVKNDRIFFGFKERYNMKNISPTILNGKNEIVKPDLNKVSRDDQEIDTEVVDNNVIKVAGYNQFELDLLPYKLKKGFYMLMVNNDKNEVYKLKFYVE
jgi:hypothetical protein